MSATSRSLSTAAVICASSIGQGSVHVGCGGATASVAIGSTAFVRLGISLVIVLCPSLSVLGVRVGFVLSILVIGSRVDVIVTLTVV